MLTIDLSSHGIHSRKPAGRRPCHLCPEHVSVTYVLIPDQGSGPSHDPSGVEVAVIVAETPLDDPVADQYALIQRHEPRDNVMDGHTLWWRMVTRRSKSIARDDGDET